MKVTVEFVPAFGFAIGYQLDCLVILLPFCGITIGKKHILDE